MDFLFSAIGVLIGFFFLIKGADIFVDGASRIAKKIGIPSIIIGLTIVSLGTSLPEMMVSIASALSGKNDMSVANVAGSNLFNICIVLASSCIIMKNTYTEKFSIKEKVSSFFRVIFLIDGDITSRFIIIANFILLTGSLVDNRLGRLDALVLLVSAGAYILALIKSANASSLKEENSENSSEISIFKQVLLIAIGSIGIMVGGDLVVDNATTIGQLSGLSENVIGLTIVAMGTSLPELVTSIVAVKKGETDIALGNALGSNILNILVVLGLSALISPIAITTVAITDMIIALIITLTVAAILFKRNNMLSKNISIVYMLTYIAYTIFAIIR